MKEYLQSFNILTNEEIGLAVQAGHEKSLKKSELFITEGHTCKSVAFVKSGLFRSYYINSEGEEITYCFFFPGSFITAYASFITQTPTEENIVAAADTEIFVIPHQALIQLEKQHVNWLRFGKAIAEAEFITMEKRVISLLKEPAEKRYKRLLENHPEYVQQIPLNHLASYLGITQRHLSRLRKSI
ncbi:Crp/Fnr family transcriptional regulator [Pseudoflavitalea sp. G-6-1-2]|uniref:Crp/Fnr family transcriptional regulator n=1 Tax=Pseudoflavitalea sp. G-6-1-2 TaxID=2728841 RepID=UPI00146E3617|nr:Crp/Fnr family transcriptional regulator [Pseudoflavitalea sp. G-6-1-2]NML23574.1 Crp/Fnr family transcriptional regulator [Pseudoflavitalea sp. G-6-1-2]